MYTVTSQEREKKTLRRTLFFFFNSDGRPVSEFFHASLASARADGGEEGEGRKEKKKKKEREKWQTKFPSSS